MTSIPSALRAFATRWPPEISPGSAALLSVVVASAVGVVVALTVWVSSQPLARDTSRAAGNGLLSIQVVDRAFDVVGQVQCVVSDEALVLEARERLAHGRAADAEVGREGLLVEPEVRVRVVDVHREDRVAQRL